MLASKAGVDPERLLEVLSGGLAGNRVMEVRRRNFLEHDFTPGFKLELHHKDLGIALRTAREFGVYVPTTAIVDQMLAALKAQGDGGLDHSALLKFIEQASAHRIESAARHGGRAPEPRRWGSGSRRQSPDQDFAEVLQHRLTHAAQAQVGERETCPVRIVCGADRIGSSGAGGSRSNTSSPAAAIWPSLSAATSAAWSISSPRAVLTTIAWRGSSASSRGPIRRRVSGVSGAWSCEHVERAGASCSDRSARSGAGLRTRRPGWARAPGRGS